MPGRPTTLAYGKAGACCACSRYGTGGLFFFLLLSFFLFFISPVSYLPFLDILGGSKYSLGAQSHFCFVVAHVFCSK